MKINTNKYDCANHPWRIRKFYDEQRANHPKFCNRILPGEGRGFAKDMTRTVVKENKEMKAKGEERNVDAFSVASLQLLHSVECLAYGRKKRAVEIIYRSIATLLRTVDAIEGRQSLDAGEEVSE